MSKRIQCPINDKGDYWIDLPDEWLGKHAAIRDEAVDAARKNDTGRTLTEFAVAIALLDDFSLPGLNGKPDNWDFEALPLSVIAWVSGETVTPFLAATTFPRISSILSQIGSNQEVENQPGDSEE